MWPSAVVYPTVPIALPYYASAPVAYSYYAAAPVVYAPRPVVRVQSPVVYAPRAHIAAPAVARPGSGSY